MSFAPGYTPTTSFANDESNGVAGRSTLRTVAVDTELANISASITELKANAQKLQRDDDKLKDLLVEPYALSEQTRALLASRGTPRGLWAAGTVYAVGDLVQQATFAYICYTAHLSANPFTAAGFWLGISADGSAAASAAAAAASEANADADRIAAQTARDTADSHRIASGNSATASANSATASGNSATASGNSAAAAAASEAAAAASYDSFDDRYLGAKAVAPALDNDGNALLVAALYWDEALPGMRSWNGTAWVTLPAATAAAISNTPAAGVTELDAQGAINGLETRKAKAGANADITDLVGLVARALINTAGNNTAIGVNTLTDTYNSGFNTAAGLGAARYLRKTDGQPLQTGVGNTVYGAGALGAAGASCDYNVAVGYLSLAANTSGYCNVAVGLRTLTANTTGEYSTAIGTDALLTATTADENTAVGAKAMLLTTTGALNTAVGSSALYTNTTGTENVAVGALASLSSSAASSNVAVGFRALEQNDSFSRNVAVGWWALRNVKSASNTSVGAEALLNASTGASNTAVGDSALRGITTGNENVGVGRDAMATGTGSANTAVGYSALKVSTGGNNTAVGHSAGIVNAGGTQNTFVGRASGSAVTSGNLNTLIGDAAGVGITTGISNTAVGQNAMNAASTGNVSNVTCLGYNAQANASNQIVLGDSGISAIRCQVTTITALSDIRDKNLKGQLDVPDAFLSEVLTPWVYEWAMRDGTVRNDGDQVGVIAQYLKDAQDRYGLQWLGLVDERNPERLEATPGKLLPLVCLRAQRHEQKLAAMEARLQVLEATDRNHQ